MRRLYRQDEQCECLPFGVTMLPCFFWHFDIFDQRPLTATTDLEVLLSERISSADRTCRALLEPLIDTFAMKLMATQIIRVAFSISN